MLCEAYSVRESSGICRWLESVSGVTTQLAGEDANAPDDTNHDTASRTPYWGVVVGQEISTLLWDDRLTALVVERTFTLTIDPGVAHTYLLTVGTTFVEVTTTTLTTQADAPDLLVEAWGLSGFGLEADGTPGGYVLTVVDDSTFRVVGAPERGGLPIFDYGYGWAQVSEVVTGGIWALQIHKVFHSYVATYWGWVRGRGEAKRACHHVVMKAGRPDAVDLLKRYTGQVAVVTGIGVVDSAALGTGMADSNMDVAQVEIVVEAVTVEAVPWDTLAGFELSLQAGTDVPGNVVDGGAIVVLDDGEGP
jgi:hypothetical protein